MSVASISMDVFQIRKQENRLRKMVHSEDTVEVIRNGGVKQSILSSDVSVEESSPYGCF